MGVSETRYKNARVLVGSHGGVVKLGERLGMSKQQSSHIFGSRPIKGIGHSIARRIEKVFSMPDGWMDTDHEMLEKAAKTGQSKDPADLEATLRRLSYTPQPMLYEALRLLADSGVTQNLLSSVARLLMAHEITAGK